MTSVMGLFPTPLKSVISRYTRKSHEDIEELLRKGEISDILKKHSLSPSAITRHIRGETNPGQIIHSEIDVDRMD